MSEKNKKFIKFTITTIIVIISGWWALRGVDFQKLIDVLSTINFWWAIAPLPIIILSHWMRAVRWKTMLKPIHESKSTWKLFSAVMIGYAANSVLPRGGEFLRPWVYSRQEKISYSATFATIIVERIIDLFSLMALFFIAFFVFGEVVFKILPDIDPQKLWLTVGVVFAFTLLSFYPPFFKAILKFAVKPISENIYNKLSELFEKFVKGIAVIKRPSQYFRLTIETALIWFFYTVPLYMWFFAFDFSMYPLGMDTAVYLIIVSGVATTLAPSPGALGVYHAAVSAALVSLFGMQKEEALAYATLAHGINYIVQLLIGGIFYFTEQVKSIPDQDTLEEELNQNNHPADQA